MTDLLEQEQNQNEEMGGDNAPLSGGKLGESEQGVEESSSSGSSSTLYKKDDTKSGIFNRGRNSSKKGFLRNKKAMVIFGGIGGLGIAVLLYLIVIFMGALLIPQVMGQIVDYQFARVTSEFADNTQRITDEDLAVEAEASDPSAFTAIQDSLGTESAESTTLWDTMLNQFSPSKAIENLKVNNGLDLVYGTKSTLLIKTPALTSIVLDDVPYDLTAQGFTKYVPVLGSLVKAAQDVKFSYNFAPKLGQALRDSDSGLIARSAAAASLRDELDIGLVAWTAGKLAAYATETPPQARVQEEKDQIAAINNDPEPDTAVTDEVNNTENAVEAADAAAENDPTSLTAAINSNGVVAATKAALTNGLSDSTLSTVTGFINPLYAVMVPICIVYDGSLDESSNSIDNATHQDASTFYYLAAAADQEKTGSPDVNAEAVGAINNAVNAPNAEGQYTVLDSNPEIRASGGTVNTNDTNLPAEASADGDYSLLNVAFGSRANALKAVAGKLCPVLTNLKLGIGLGLINIALVIGTGPEDLISNSALDADGLIATDALAANAAGNSISSFFSAATASRAASMVAVEGPKVVGQVAGLTAVTLAAKLIVMAKAGEDNSGFSQGNDLINNADAGGNFVANEADQQGFYGEPLDSAAVSESNQATQVALAKEESQESFSQRYLALDNASSLASRVGMTLYTHLNGSIFSYITTEVGKIFNPVAILSSIFSSLGSRAAAAAGTIDNSDYGNVQFGWPQSQEALIDSSPSYNPLENQQALSASGEESAIAQTYGPCFTDTIGELLSNGDILRDSNGSVSDATDYLCSPTNLGPNNPQYGQMVFRWRLAMSYDNTLNELASESNPGN